MHMTGPSAESFHEYIVLSSAGSGVQKQAPVLEEQIEAGAWEQAHVLPLHGVRTLVG